MEIHHKKVITHNIACFVKIQLDLELFSRDFFVLVFELQIFFCFCSIIVRPNFHNDIFLKSLLKYFIWYGWGKLNCYKACASYFYYFLVNGWHCDVSSSYRIIVIDNYNRWDIDCHVDETHKNFECEFNNQAIRRCESDANLTAALDIYVWENWQDASLGIVGTEKGGFFKINLHCI